MPGKNLQKASIITKPSVSIITVVYNGAKHLENTIKSVIALNYDNIEYIIIDGGSTDDTLDIIKGYAEHIDHWISEKDRGIYDAMNKGVKIATGQWINFMNAGDTFASVDALSFFEDTALDADIIYGDAIILYPTFKTLLRTSPLVESWKRMPFCHQASFTKRNLINNSPFNLAYKLSSDFDFIYSAYLKQKRFNYIKQVICEFDFTEGASIKNIFQSVKERKTIVLKNSFSIRKWTYHSLAISYIYFTFYTKKIIGPKLTNLVTRILKGP